MTTPGPVNCRKLSRASQVTRTDLPLKVTEVGEPGSELSTVSAVGKIRSPGWQRDADVRHGDMYWVLEAWLFMPLTDKPLPERLKVMMSRMLLVTLTEPAVILMGSALAACGIVRIDRNTMPKAPKRFALIQSIG